MYHIVGAVLQEEWIINRRVPNANKKGVIVGGHSVVVDSMEWREMIS